MNRLWRILFGLAATLNVAAATIAAIDQAWIDAIFHLAIAAAITFIFIIQRPTSVPAALPERGLIAISFTGGPLDGADVPLPPIELPEMLGTELVVSGTTYTVTTVEHTCYTAEAEANQP